MLEKKSDLNANQASHNAQQQCIARLLQAFLREQLLAVVAHNDKFIMPLPQPHGLLQLEHFTTSSLAHVEIQGAVFYLAPSQATPKQIVNVMELLAIIESALAPQLDLQRWQHFVKEIANHITNSTLSYENAKSRNATLTATMTKAGHDNLYQWLNEKGDPHNKSLFFEQWVSHGHPYHPCSKTKLGLSPQEVIRYSPEFRQHTDIYIAALHRDAIHIETMETGLFYCDWFFDYFPNIKMPWLLQLKLHKLDPNHYLPLPIHPWQATHEIRNRFASLIASRYLHIFDNVTMPTNPTLSFRTVAPVASSRQPHIKLPVAVQTTSAIRTVSPASTENGPKISKFLKIILQQEYYFQGYLRCMFEFVGLHVTGYDDQTAKHLSVIFRDNVTNCLNNDETGIVVAALFERTPIAEVPLFIEIMQSAGVKSLDDAKDYFHRYANMVLSSYLDLYLLYGVALEAHQQNTIAVFQHGEPVATIARDFGGLRLHLPTFREKGFNLAPYPDSTTCSEERTTVRNKLLHTTYQYHLGAWVFHLAKHYKVPESLFWHIVTEITVNRFEILKKRMTPQLWAQERYAILENEWALKALLRMRLNNVSHNYIYVPIANPLKSS